VRNTWKNEGVLLETVRSGIRRHPVDGSLKRRRISVPVPMDPDASPLILEDFLEFCDVRMEVKALGSKAWAERMMTP